jgi:YegS/Rv2252/BmrU family lipid kinase
MFRRALVIINPTAGLGRTCLDRRALTSALGADGIAVSFLASRSAGHATELARSAAAEGGFDVVIAGGGDGTAREVISGVLGSSRPTTPVAVLALGTGNDLAHVAGTASLSAATRAICAGIVRPMDVIAVDCEIAGKRVATHAASFAAVGLAADVVRLTTPAVKRIFGPRLCYSVGFFRALARYRPVRATVLADAREYRDDFLLICGGNTSHAGGQTMHLSPGANAHDGHLNLSLIRATTRVQVALQFFRLLRGTHIYHPRASYFPAGNIDIKTAAPADVQLDGDVIGTTPARFRVLPGALHLVVAAPQG